MVPKIYEVRPDSEVLFEVIFVLLAKRAQDGSQRAFTWPQEGPRRLLRRLQEALISFLCGSG